MGRKTLLFAALVAALTLGLASGAGGGNGLPPLTVNPSSGPPGATFTVSGTECFFDSLGAGAVGSAGENGFLGPEVDVTVNFTPPLVMTTNADPEGNWSVTFTVPTGTPPGTYTVSATCHNEVLDLSTDGGVGSAGGDVAAAQTPYPPGTGFTVNAPPPAPAAPGAPPAPAGAAPVDAAPAPAAGGTPQLTG